METNGRTAFRSDFECAYARIEDFSLGGKLDVKDVVQPIYDEINEEYGLSEKP